MDCTPFPEADYSNFGGVVLYCRIENNHPIPTTVPHTFHKDSDKHIPVLHCAYSLSIKILSNARSLLSIHTDLLYYMKLPKHYLKSVWNHLLID